MELARHITEADTGALGAALALGVMLALVALPLLKDWLVRSWR